MARQVHGDAFSFLFRVHPVPDTPKGYGSTFCRDIRVAPISKNYSLVYWSGEGAEITPVWSYHISRRRPNTTLNSKHAFDEHLDGPLNLAAERLRVIVDSGRAFGHTVLRDGMLLVSEGTVAFLEHSPVGGPQTVVQRVPAVAAAEVRGDYFDIE
jgi:hypothetical protein